ncbi:hypothetical protein HYW74_01100 [Candidatus Pacearchaeota archaeon]|nr:hypothetical protein [Candidatus Pacearchaeota archaeon]
MIYLIGKKKNLAEKFMMQALEVAKFSTCLRSKCGSIVVDSESRRTIGRGFNSPPGNRESQRRCLIDKISYHDKVGDKSCCIHAEQRAIIDAVSKNPHEVSGSSLYFIRLSQENKILKAGMPYCTHCSKLALDVGIDKFVLWHDKGICSYDTEEYNQLSYEYNGD